MKAPAAAKSRVRITGTGMLPAVRAAALAAHGDEGAGDDAKGEDCE